METLHPLMIDHTNLKTDPSVGDIDQLCYEALKYGFKTVCVRGEWVNKCRENLKGKVDICAVAGFPTEMSIKSLYLEENKNIWENGLTLRGVQILCDKVDEIDVVMDITSALAGDWDKIQKQLLSLTKVTRNRKGKRRILKVIVEAALLDRDQLARACTTVVLSGAQFVKTSTGFLVNDERMVYGATVADVDWMRRAVRGVVGIKAAGGIRTAKQAQLLVNAGATRLGCSKSVELFS